MRAGPVRLTGNPPIAGPVSSVYVHAPFCPKRCLYCDFAVTVSSAPDLELWLHALRAEWAMVLSEGLFPMAASLETLFVGGGTPSHLGPGAMEGLAGILGPDLLENPELEWTAEANPDSFSREVAEGWSRAGVNRVSLGAQSFQAGPLGWMGRIHGPQEPELAVGRAREAGIRNLSVDLIFGLPPEVERDWARDLAAVLALEVPHLSLYGLTVEGGTPLGRAVREGEVSPPDESRYREEFLLAAETLEGEGYRQYELSNFALPGYEARHNLVYWSHSPYLGLGSSAHSFLHPRRRWNLRDWDAYQGALSGGTSPVESQEGLTSDQIRLEAIWLGLRTDRGLDLADLPPSALDRVRSWAREGLASVEGDGVRLTPEGWLLLDRLVVELDAEWE